MRRSTTAAPGSATMLKAMLQGALLALGLSTASAWAQAPADGNLAVNVQKVGELVTIDASLAIAATPQEVWNVLTDFDHMADFIHGLQSSKVVAKKGNVWRIAQKGVTTHAGFSIKFESLRDVTVQPVESVQSHLVSGTLKKHDTLTRLTAEGNGTRVTYHAESISGIWVPPLIGTSVVEGEVRKQFQDIQTEIMKRKPAN
jgi:carbon monoxide dehydrogenase subunit G